MSKILILAPSGMGKTTSLRNLPPECTAIINCDRKELPLRGGKLKFQNVKDASGKTDWEKSNYIETDSAANVLKALQMWEAVPAIKNIVIDTITHMITKDYMTTTIGKDFKAYQQLGKSFYDVINYVRSSTKNIIIMGHVDRRITDTGEIVWDLKSHGNMIKDLVPASYFTTVLIGEKIKDEMAPTKFRYVFRTQSEGNDPAKSPAYVDGAKVDTALLFHEDNDVSVVLEKLEHFETASV